MSERVLYDSYINNRAKTLWVLFVIFLWAYDSQRIELTLFNMANIITYIFIGIVICDIFLSIFGKVRLNRFVWYAATIAGLYLIYLTNFYTIEQIVMSHIVTGFIFSLLTYYSFRVIERDINIREEYKKKGITIIGEDDGT